MNGEKTEHQLKNYSVAILTIVSIIAGAPSCLIYYVTDGWIYALLLLYATILCLLGCLYKYIRKLFDVESWSDGIIVTAIIIPLLMGGLASIVISGSL